MIALLRLDGIGDDWVYRGGRLVAGARDGAIPANLRRVAHWLAAERIWVARVTGADGRYGLAREFLRPRKDHVEEGSGVAYHYELRPGVYEVNERVTWRVNRRYFVRSVAGRVEEISAADARGEVAA